jgi:hypothetical protein
MRMRSLIAVLIGLPALVFAGDYNSPMSPSDKPELVFKTGFEGDTHLIPAGQSDNDIVGHDPTQPNKSDIKTDLGINSFRIEYTHGDISRRYAKIIPEPGNPKNHVLEFWVADSWHATENQTKARVQADIYGLKKGFPEFYQSVRVYLDPNFAALRKYPHPILWFTLAEFWNHTYWAGPKYKYRTGLGIGKPTADESDLNFICNAEGDYQHQLWQGKNLKVKVPIGHWFTLEYYYKLGNAQTGRFYVAMTPDGGRRQVVYDIQGWTCNPNDPAPEGMTDWNPMKLYTSKELVAFMKAQGKPLQIYWDDLEIWKNRRPTDSTPVAPPPVKTGAR